jgi:hypothetical protein
MEGRESKKGGFDGRTYLFIPTHPDDTGTEPLRDEPKEEFWVSPDIVVIPPGGTPGDKAVAGVENEVRVTVRNAGGIEATDAFVDAFINAPSTVMTPTTSIPVGAGFLTVPGYGRESISFPWTPLPTDSGHRCLIARVSLTIPPDSYRDPTAFDVIGDRHVAQRNIHIVSTAQAMRTGFPFLVLNPAREREPVLIRAEQIRDQEALFQLATAMGCGSAEPAEQRWEVGLSWAGEDAPDGKRGEGSDSIELVLASGEARRALLRVAPEGEAAGGGLSAIRIAQEDAQGTVRGGLTVVLRS